jgi:hypothetical protein
VAVAHVGSATSQTANNQSNTSLSVTLGSTTIGHVNFIDIVAETATAVDATFATPSGWTLLGGAFDSGAPALTAAVFYRAFQSGDPSSVTVSWTNTGQAIAVCSGYSGVNTTTPVGEYTIEAKGTTNTSYTVSVTTSATGWIRSGFGNRSGHTWSALADTQRGTVTLASASSIVVQDSAADVASGTITKTATGSGSTGIGAEWAYLIKPSGGGGSALTLTITDDIGMSETGANLLAVVETMTDPVGVTDTMVRTHTVGGVTPPPSTTAADFTAVVEVAFDDTPRSSAPTYTDVTTYVRAASIPSMSRGRSNEFDPQAQAGRAQVEFKNTDNRFTVGNDSSPYAPLQIRRPIRFRMAYGGSVYPLWQGFIDSWGNGRDETTGVAEVEASDRLARAASVRLKGLVSAEILADSPSAHYTLGDDGESLTAGDQSTVLGNPPLTIGGDEANAVDFGVGAAPGPDGGTVVSFTVEGGAT